MTDQNVMEEHKDDDALLVCEQCGDEWSEMIMLKDDLWLSIAQEEEFLCVGCIEKRLGRPVTGWDLTDCALNHENWPLIMFEVIQHTSYADAYRRIFLGNWFHPTMILLGLIRGYVHIRHNIGVKDDDDLLEGDRVFLRNKGPEGIKKIRVRFGLDEPANDNSRLDQSTG